MKKQLEIIILIMFCVGNCINSQQIILNAGDELLQPVFSHSFSVAGPVTETIHDVSSFPAHGYQPPGYDGLIFNLETDSLALVALYNATNGPGWTNNANWLTGQLNSWNGITVSGNRVTMVKLEFNNLTGTIPPEIGDLSELTHLSLRGNQLSGIIPYEIGSLYNLWLLDLGQNHLSGTIPTQIEELTMLHYLILLDNELGGSIPTEIWFLENLEVLSLSFNYLYGILPEEIGYLLNLTHLNLYYNQFSGTLPNSLYCLPNLEALAIGGNYFSGPLSMDLCNMVNLNVLGIDHCSFEGESCEVVNCLIDRGGWEFFEHSPQWDGFTYPTNCSANLSSDSLALVALYNATNGPGWTNNTNWLAGQLNSWQGITITGNRVAEVRLDFNNLTGTIPPEIGNLSQLTYLNLCGNQLFGSIPAEIGNLVNLWLLDLGQNDLSGTIPTQLESLTMLHILHLTDNELSGQIPTELWGLGNLTVLSLSFNFLHGILPEEIGLLLNLTHLNLYYNQFSGTLPNSLYSLPNLEALAIGGNYFSGPLSMDLCSMFNLNVLGIDHCSFEGESCEVVNCLIDRGGWEFFEHSPQYNGFVYPDDCETESPDMMHVVAAAGNYFRNQNFSVSSTLGETVIETLQTGNVILTQGFQQPWDYGFYQLINIVQGWSGISGYIEPYNGALEYLFEDHQDALVVLSNFGGMYFPSQGINTLNSWNTASGYQVKAYEEFNLRLKGWKNMNTSMEYDLGWHLLPVISACNVNIPDLLGENEGLVIVKQVAGTGVFWPEYGINTIGDLLPGKGYYLLADGLVNISFPDCNGRKDFNIKTNDDIINLTPWADPIPTAGSHLVLFPEEIFPESAMQPGDFVGAFNALGQCAGLMQIDDLNKSICLTLYGDDQLTPAQDGFVEGEPITFRYFSVNDKTEKRMQVNFDPIFPNQGSFVNHGLSAIKSVEFSNSTNEINSNLDFIIFPNPARDEVNIAFNFEVHTQTSIQFLTAHGLKVKELKVDPSPTTSQRITLDVSQLKSGTYFVTIKTADRKGVKKLTIIH